MVVEEKTGAGWAPGLGPFMQKLLHGITRSGRGKKSSTRTPQPPAPKKAPHWVNRQRELSRADLLIEGIRLGVLDSSRPPIGTWRQGGQFRTWQALTAAVERARKAAA